MGLRGDLLGVASDTGNTGRGGNRAGRCSQRRAVLTVGIGVAMTTGAAAGVLVQDTSPCGQRPYWNMAVSTWLGRVLRSVNGWRIGHVMNMTVAIEAVDMARGTLIRTTIPAAGRRSILGAADRRHGTTDTARVTEGTGRRRTIAMNRGIDRTLRRGSAARSCTMTGLTACRPVDDTICLKMSAVTGWADTMAVCTSLNRTELTVADRRLHSRHR